MTNPMALIEEATRLHKAGDLAQAAGFYEQFLIGNPNDSRALANYASLHFACRNFERALELAGAAIELEPDLGPAWNTRGVALGRLNKPADAIESFDIAIQLKPDLAEAYSNRAASLLDLAHFDRARADCEHALKLNPNLPVAHAMLGALLRDQRRYDDACKSYEHAIALAPQLIEARNGLAITLLRMGRVEEAIAANEQAIVVDPTNAESHNDRGAIFFALRRYDEALACFDTAISLRPDFGDAQWNKSLLLLLRGRYTEGWETYEWRWRSRSLAHSARNFAAPLWNGEDLTGKTILIHAEQGLGDTIQFARYIPMVAARGGKVLFEGFAPLAGLLSRLDSRVTMLSKGSPLPHFDVQCPLMSLPRAFRTTIETVPASIPYLSAEPQHLARWRARLGPRTKLRVGLTWAGNRGYALDFSRSMTAQALSSLLEVDCEFHCLHRDITADDRVWLDAHPDVRIYGTDLVTFEDTAAIVSLMNVVVTVDTATAHLAGGLGKPTDVLLAYAPDFRWLTERSDSPWYPTVELFRQSAPGDWSEPVARVKEHLQRLAAR